MRKYLWEAFPYDPFDCGGLDDFVCEAKDQTVSPAQCGNVDTDTAQSL